MNGLQWIKHAMNIRACNEHPAVLKEIEKLKFPPGLVCLCFVTKSIAYQQKLTFNFSAKIVNDPWEAHDSSSSTHQMAYSRLPRIQWPDAHHIF